MCIRDRDYILHLLVISKDTQTTENLGELRNQIDDCDNEIIEVLAKRMRVIKPLEGDAFLTSAIIAISSLPKAFLKG